MLKIVLIFVENLTKTFKVMDFEYRIENDGIKIFEHKNRLSESVIIPEIIDGYPVNRISCYVFLYSDSLKYINGVELIDGVNIINNKFIYHNRLFNTIKYMIDYDCIFINNKDYEYFIENKLYESIVNK